MALGNAAGVYEQLEDYEEAESVLTVTGPPSFPDSILGNRCAVFFALVC